MRFCKKNPDWRKHLSNMAPYRDQSSGKVTSVEREYQNVRMELISKAVASAAREAVAKIAFETGPDSFEASVLSKKLGSKAGFANLAKNIGAFKTKAAAMRAYVDAQSTWRAMNIRLMARLNFLKFVRSTRMRAILLDTGTATLMESGRGRGIWVAAGGNLAGRTLMAVRAVLKDRTRASELEYAHFDEIEEAADAFATRYVETPEIVAVLRSYAGTDADEDDETRK